MKPTYRAALGYLKRTFLVNEFQESLEVLRVVDGHPQGPNVFGHRDGAPRELNKVGSYRVDRERNTVMAGLIGMPRAAADGIEIDRFLLLDDDHSFTPSQVYQLLGLVSAERPVVSGLYFAIHAKDRHHPFVRPLVFHEHADRNGYDTDYDYPRNTLVPVDHIGLGFCAVWRPFIEEMKTRLGGPTWFDFGHRPDGRHILEDEGFCRRVRHIMERPIHVHTGICTPHWKLWGFTEEDMDRQTALFEKEERMKAEKRKSETTHSQAA